MLCFMKNGLKGRYFKFKFFIVKFERMYVEIWSCFILIKGI